MTPTETTAILRQFNEWCRGLDVEPPKPGEVFDAIDAAIEMFERTQELETAMRDFTWSDDSESQADCARSVLENQSD